MKLRNKKTGEVGYVNYFVDYTNDDGTEIAFTLENNTYLYGSLAELNAEWEDYEPPEPLIKDENIRKAVRAWAKVNSIKEALYAEVPNRSLCVLTDMGKDDYCIEFVGWIPTLKDSERYTIAELCGDEE